MPHLRVGVLGLSHDHVWGNLAALAAGEQGRLVAAAEPAPGLRERLRDLHGGVALHETFDALLERRDLDAVMIFADNRLDRKSTRLNSSHIQKSRMPSSA